MYLNHMAGGENLHSTEGVHLPTIAKLCSAKPIPGNEGKRAGGKITTNPNFSSNFALELTIFERVLRPILSQVEGLREQAKALITYAGMIPYRYNTLPLSPVV